MTDKSLKDKAIQIQGKDYVLVSDRIIFFNENYPKGCINTDLVSDPDSDIILVKATVRPTEDMSRYFTGYSQAVKGAGFINKTAALENAETSAVGRALAMMGIGVIDSVASVDEIKKAEGTDYKLASAKGKVLTAFITAGVKELANQKLFIKQTLDQDTIQSIADAEKVIKALEEGGESVEILKA